MDIRPAVGAALAPLLALLVGAACFTLVLLSALGANYPLWLVAPALLAAMVLLPLAGMGFVYSIVGASVVIDATKQSATWQQGLLGLGVGTRELVPFAKIALFEVVEVARAGVDAEEHAREPLLQWDLVLVKSSERRLNVATVAVLRPAGPEAYRRIAGVALAIGKLTGAEVRLPPATEGLHGQRHATGG